MATSTTSNTDEPMEIDPSYVSVSPRENKKPDSVATTTVVKPEMSGLPMASKLSHVLAIIVGGVVALAVAAVLADGISVIKLKDIQELPIATAANMRQHGFHHRLDQLLGPTYGVGLHHDQSGAYWNEIRAGDTVTTLLRQLGRPVVAAALPSVISTDKLKHPVAMLECDDLQTAGLAAMALGFTAEIVGVLMIIFHALALIGAVGSKMAKPLSALIWFVLSAGFGTVIVLACGIYTAEWTCHNEVIPKIRLSDHFVYNYGFYFAIAGFVSAALVFVVTLFFLTSDDKPISSVAGSGVKALLVYLVGAGVVLAASLSTVGGQNGFDLNINIDLTTNPCYHQKPYHAAPFLGVDGSTVAGDNYFANRACFVDAVSQTLEQAGANVTRGYVGGMDVHNRVPITGNYADHGLCAVNVHWHLGAEHLSVGQFDQHGSGPNDTWVYTGSNTRPNNNYRRKLTWSAEGSDGRQLASTTSSVRLGGQCHHYNANDPKFTTPYNWQYCTHMEVGQTYEIHWPHSAAGMCGTQWQYQSPFYDGVFCRDGVVTIAPLNTYKKIGVQGQVFTIVNDATVNSSLYYPNLFRGMLTAADGNAAFGSDMAMYTGSTTGTSRDNDVCSRYTPITWQVDRTCHMVSASTFDKMCQDMLLQADDMHSDVHPHGARAVVSHELVANNQQTRK
jgi:hypothetical protein